MLEMRGHFTKSHGRREAKEGVVSESGWRAFIESNCSRCNSRYAWIVDATHDHEESRNCSSNR